MNNNNYNFTVATIKRRGGSTATKTHRLLKANRFYSYYLTPKALYVLKVASNKKGNPIAFMLVPTDKKGDGVVKTAKGGVLNCATLSELFFKNQPKSVERLDFRVKIEKDSLIYTLQQQ